jgi:hypothetical protein
VTATATATATPTSTATATPTPRIELRARGRAPNGRARAQLAWRGATSSNVDIYRNGAWIVTTANDGFYTDLIGSHGQGTYTYRVCEESTQICSNDATVTF